MNSYVSYALLIIIAINICNSNSTHTNKKPNTTPNDTPTLHHGNVNAIDIRIVSFINNIFESSHIIYALSLGQSINTHEYIRNKSNNNNNNNKDNNKDNNSNGSDDNDHYIEYNYNIETVLFINQENSMNMNMNFNKSNKKYDQEHQHQEHQHQEHQELFNIAVQESILLLNKHWSRIIILPLIVTSSSSNSSSSSSVGGNGNGQNSIFQLYNPLIWQEMGLGSGLGSGSTLVNDNVNDNVNDINTSAYTTSNILINQRNNSLAGYCEYCDHCDCGDEYYIGYDCGYNYIIHVELTQLVLKPFVADLMKYHILPQHQSQTQIQDRNRNNQLMNYFVDL